MDKNKIVLPDNNDQLQISVYSMILNILFSDMYKVDFDGHCPTVVLYGIIVRHRPFGDQPWKSVFMCNFQLRILRLEARNLTQKQSSTGVKSAVILRLYHYIGKFSNV